MLHARGQPQSGGYGGEHRDEHVDYHLPSFLLHSNPPFLSLIGYTIIPLRLRSHVGVYALPSEVLVLASEAAVLDGNSCAETPSSMVFT